MLFPQLHLLFNNESDCWSDQHYEAFVQSVKPNFPGDSWGYLRYMANFKKLNHNANGGYHKPREIGKSMRVRWENVRVDDACRCCCLCHQVVGLEVCSQLLDHLVCFDIGDTLHAFLFLLNKSIHLITDLLKGRAQYIGHAQMTVFAGVFHDVSCRWERRVSVE